MSSHLIGPRARPPSNKSTAYSLAPCRLVPKGRAKGVSSVLRTRARRIRRDYWVLASDLPSRCGSATMSAAVLSAIFDLGSLLSTEYVSSLQSRSMSKSQNQKSADLIHSWAFVRGARPQGESEHTVLWAFWYDCTVENDTDLDSFDVVVRRYRDWPDPDPMLP